MPFGHLREARQVGTVARRRNDERAVDDRRGIRIAPQRNAFATEIANDFRRTFGFAFRRDHRRRQAACARGKRLAASLDEADAVARAGVRISLPQPRDAGADNSYR